MKRILNFITSVEQSLAAVETPQKKMEQLEAAKQLAPKFINGIWLTITLDIISLLEATIKK